MFRKNYFTSLLAAALFLTSGIAAFAQTAPVGGQVVIEKADGSTQPVAGALVEAYRVDVKGKLPSGKTDKKGYFTFAGFPLGGSYVLSISGSNITPRITPNIKPGADKMLITVVEGDGKKLSEEEVRQALAAPATPGSNTAGAPQLSADDKKKLDEQNKLIEEIKVKNERKKNSNAITQKALEEGDKAFKAKNYDLAITKFDEGIAADPEFAGSAPILLNYKAAALKERGFGLYKQSATADAATKAANFENARKDYLQAISAFDKGLNILKTASSTDAATQKKYESSKNDILTNYVEVYRLMTRLGGDTSKSKEAIPIFEQYTAVETDAAKKLKAQIILGDILREAGNSEEAITAYRKGLEMSPDNPDALAGLGLSLFNSGVIADNKTQKQEGLNYMQRFAEVAADNHPLKSSVRDAVEYLKTQDKLAPQKTTKTGTKKKQ